MQATIELACGHGVHRNLANAEAMQGGVIERLMARGVQTRTLSPALLDALQKASDEVLEDEAALDSDFARVLAHQRAFRKEYAAWRRLAYPSPSLLSDTDGSSDPTQVPNGLGNASKTGAAHAN